MAAQLPSDFASKALYATYIKALPDEVPNHGDVTENETHQALLTLTARPNATKVYASNSGLWSDGTKWEPAGVPAAGAKVLIGEGVVVTYDLNSAVKLDKIRVDGEMHWLTDIDTKIAFETLFSTHSSDISIGDHHTEVAADKTAQIIINDAGEISPLDDPYMIGRGFIANGHFHCAGTTKKKEIKVVSADGPMAFTNGLPTTGLTLSESPTGWRVGDTIIVGATRKQGWQYSNALGRPTFVPHENERVTITQIIGNNISFTPALQYNHNTPTHSHPTKQLRCYVVNITRNIQFRPENYNIPDRQRPHIMFMHPHHTSPQWASAIGCGRTSKYADRNGIAIEQTVAASGVFNRNGAFGDGSTFPYHFKIRLFWSNSSKVTIVGTDTAGNPQTVIMSALGTGFAPSELWSSITSITNTGTNSITQARCAIDARSFAMVSNAGNGRLKNWHDSSNTSLTTFDQPEEKSNVQGRYPWHFHKGPKDNILEMPYANGLVADGSPGWGIVHHGMNYNLLNCIATDFFGAGIVSETGGETGSWDRCLAIGSRAGALFIDKDGPDMLSRDFGRRANGSWFTGRMPKVTNFIAIGCGQGITYNVRGESDPLEDYQLDQPLSLFGKPTATLDDAPIGHFFRPECIACTDHAFHVIKANPFQGHDVRTVIDEIFAWSCGGSAGTILITYTEHYTIFKPVLILGFNDNFSGINGKGQSRGTHFDNNTADQVFVEPYIEGYRTAMSLFHNHVIPSETVSPRNGRIVIAPTFVNCTFNYEELEPIDDVDIPLNALTSTLTLAVNPYGVFPNTGAREIVLTGTKTDSLSAATGQTWWPGGFDSFKIIRVGMETRLARYGYRVNAGDSKKLVPFAAIFSDRASGKMDVEVIPVEPHASYILGSTQNRGACDISNNTPPVLNNFSVDVLAGDVTTITVASRATGVGVEMFMKTEPLYGVVEDNGDGTVSYRPLPGFLGTEEFDVWVINQNFKKDRATVTVNVLASLATPTIVPDSFGEIEFETTKTINVLANDIGVISLAGATVTGGDPGDVTTFADGRIEIDSLTGTPGPFSLQYTANPGGLIGEVTGVLLPEVIEPTTPPPVEVTIATARTKYGVPKVINLLDGVTGSNLAVAQANLRNPSQGILEPSINGPATFYPFNGVLGTVLIDRRITNGETSVDGTASINVARSLMM